MQIGLMWYDDDPRKTLDAKIEQAIARYHEKYGHAPNACYVNPAAVAIENRHNGMRVIPARTIRPGYLWVGVEEKQGIGSAD
jgi:hypothetical protein